tara:strand:+ start:271 stop:588 length:318 start_codon:yes stop_codon:yes gene_type:complete
MPKTGKHKAGRPTVFSIYHEALEASENVAASVSQDVETPARERRVIPPDVKMRVWRRDRGQCVLCESRERIEYDHIIPFSKGGADTVRNLQLLCGLCNRKKAAKV